MPEPAPIPWRHWPAAADILAEAFTADPVLGWLLGRPERRLPALQRFFAIQTRDLVLRHGLSVGTDDGVALVLPGSYAEPPLGGQVRQAREFVGIFGTRLPRAFGVQLALQRRHPREPHVYLPYIGVRPGARGRGLGRALLRPVLARCDAEGLPVYLEASSPDNARLYRRLGFVGTEVLRPLGSPPIELMLRPAR